MRSRKHLQSVVSKGFCFIAYISTCIDQLYELRKNLYAIYAFLLNLLFSFISSIFISLFLTLFNFIFSLNLDRIFISSLSLLMILSFFINITTFTFNSFNLPKVLLRLFLFLRLNRKAILKYMLISYTCLTLSWLLSYQIIRDFFSENNLDPDLNIFLSFVLAAVITLSLYYALPPNKDNRDANELLISPLIMCAYILLAYKINMENIISNVSKGDSQLAGYILLFLMLTVILQGITYFKKLVEKIHDLPDYNQRIQHYNVYFKKTFTSLLMQSKRGIATIKNKKEKSASIEEMKQNKINILMYLLIITVVLGLLFLAEKLLQNYSDQIEIYIIYPAFIIIFCLFLLNRLYVLFLRFFIGRQLSKLTRNESLGLAVTLIGMIILFLSNYLSSHTIVAYFGILTFAIGVIIVVAVNFIRWLLKKKKY